MKRLQESRHKFLSRFRPVMQSSEKGEGPVVRDTIQTVMMEEWEGLRGEVWASDPREGYLEHVIGVMDQLKEELIQEGTSVYVCVIMLSIRIILFHI